MGIEIEVEPSHLSDRNFDAVIPVAGASLTAEDDDGSSKSIVEWKLVHVRIEMRIVELDDEPAVQAPYVVRIFMIESCRKVVLRHLLPARVAGADDAIVVVAAGRPCGEGVAGPQGAALGRVAGDRLGGV